VCNCIVDNWNILCVIVCVFKWSVLRNSADFLFKASENQVAELSVNATELSVNAIEFQFSKRFMFLSHVKHGQILANFINFFSNFPKSDEIDHL
jgi:hypothetical protein